MQWNIIKSPEIELHIHGQLILTKMSKQFIGEKILSTTSAETKKKN